MNNTTILSIVALALGAILFLVSVAGVFWPATPVTDPGMLSTVAVFILFGVFGFLLGRRQDAQA